MTFEEELWELLVGMPGSTVRFDTELGAVRCSISTLPEHSVRRVPITTTSPPIYNAQQAFQIALTRHRMKLQASRCISREVEGKHG